MIYMMRIISLVDESNGSTHRKVCAWCNGLIREGGEPVSHGICPDCSEREVDRFFGAKSLKREEEAPDFSALDQIFQLTQDR